MEKVVITEAVRTPIGAFQGNLSKLHVAELGKILIEKIISTSNLNNDNIDEVVLGNVLSAGTGQAPARQAALKAGLSENTECLTINKMCGSGLKAVMLADQAIRCGDAETIIAGGMENMSAAPYLLDKARDGYRLGHDKLYDSMIRDGLWDVYNDIHMGSCAEKCARDYKLDRVSADEFAVESYKRAINAQKEGKFDSQITEVTFKTRKGEVTVSQDEEPLNVRFDKIPTLKPAFDSEGVITVANASKINDGAAALLVTSEKYAKENGLNPLVEIIAQSSAAKAPIDFTTAPADAIAKVLSKANLTIDDIGLFEINEAFAVVNLAVNKILNLNMDKVNVNGGAVALGHPIGASGARILVTLIHEMKKRNTEIGLASLCIGGGEASALIVKNYN